MCGIVGYVGKNKDAHVGLEALKRLEYRGYDSAGMALCKPETGEIVSVKATGPIRNLEKKLEGTSLEGGPYVFYTRWATHGGVSEQNCHPHADCKGNIWVAHNGIVENYQQLKEKLVAEGHVFRSETDTEVIPHLIETFFKGSLEEAVMKTLPLLRGAYALVIISKEDPGKLIAVRNSAPLLVGLGDNEYLVASDPAAVVSLTKNVIYLNDGDMAVLKENGFSVQDLHGTRVERNIDHIEWNVEDAQKSGYEHFMLKEIMEQPQSLVNAFRGRLLEEEGNVKLGGLDLIQDRLKEIERVHILGCGTASYAGMVGDYMIEQIAGIPVEREVASEFRYRNPLIDKKTCYLFISQSGETADTLAALKLVKEKGGLTVGIINVVGSSVAREVEAGIYNHAGPEIGVASTKAFTSQLLVLALVAIYLGRQRSLSVEQGKALIKEIQQLPGLVERVLQNKEAIQKIAEKYKNSDHFLFIGRTYNYPVALEGSLKLKEISYAHAEAYPGGELKHGAIALIDETFPTVAIALKDSVYEKMVSNIQEIRARNGKIIAVATEGDEGMWGMAEDVMYVPKVSEVLSPIVSIIPLQLFAYFVAVYRGYDPDKPRNLAKSVTVE